MDSGVVFESQCSGAKMKMALKVGKTEREKRHGKGEEERRKRKAEKRKRKNSDEKSKKVFCAWNREGEFKR